MTDNDRRKILKALDEQCELARKEDRVMKMTVEFYEWCLRPVLALVCGERKTD